MAAPVVRMLTSGGRLLLGLVVTLGVVITASASPAEAQSQPVTPGLDAVGFNWDALVAGDIDHIAEHVRGEEWALQLNSPEGDGSVAR